MSSYLGVTIRAGLVFPLILVAALAGGLGFVAGRGVYPTEPVPLISTVVTSAAVPTPTPSAPPSPATPSTPSQPARPPASRGGAGSASSCPAGCECRYPSGGVVIVCHGGGAVRVP